METTRKFEVKNENFTCTYCQTKVTALSVGCRNHCPNCLCSKHLDIYPGDRAASCGGKQTPYSYKLSNKKGLILLFQCESCHKETCNKAALDDPIQADSFDKILKITTNLKQ